MNRHRACGLLSLFWSLTFSFPWMPTIVRADEPLESSHGPTGQVMVAVRPLTEDALTGTLTTLDSTTIQIRTETGRDVSWPVAEVMWVAGAGEIRMQAEVPPLVLLANDDVLCGQVLSIDEESLTLDWTVTTPATQLVVPLDTVRSIVFGHPEQPHDQRRIQQVWALLRTNQDRLISTDFTHIDGELDGLSDGVIQLKTPLASVTASVEESFAIVLNSELVSAPTPEGTCCLATLGDGSRVTWKSLTLTPEGTLVGTAVWGMTVSVPIEQVIQVHFLGDRVIAIADLEAQAYQFTPYLNEQHPLVINRNVRGGPLRLRGTSYATGIGVHSKSAVSYDLEGADYQQFRAVIGVDDTTHGEGSVVFAVELDGERVYESLPLSGRSPAEAIGPLNVANRKALTLIVEFGEFANLNDVADWCNAVLIKSSP